MKKFAAWLAFIILAAGSAFGAGEFIDRDNLSIKAGPTEAGEGIAMVWVEALIYPKLVKEDRILSLGVRTTSKVKSVRASFDFASKPVALASNDGLSWNTTFFLPSNAGEGIHMARYQINAKTGSIQRTVEFFIENSAGVKAAASVFSGNVVLTSGWPLTVTSTSSAFVNGAERLLYGGQKLTGLSKTSWYKVRFEDGETGWVPAASVKDPAEGFFRAGVEAFKAKNYPEAVKNFQQAAAADSGLVKGQLYLAKSLSAQGERDAAAAAVKQALRLNDRDLPSRVFADELAQDYFSAGREKLKSRRYHEAAAAFRKLLDLKPDHTQAWIELGRALRQVGLKDEAYMAWKDGLKYDPVNPKLRALLGNQSFARAEIIQSGVVVPAMIADDSLQIVKEVRTSKGTKIETALKSVLAMTKSLGTPVAEKGWQIKKEGGKFLVSYLCQQGGGALESFSWLVDVDTRQALPRNDNARLLMSRW